MLKSLKPDLFTIKAIHALPRGRTPFVHKKKGTIGGTEFLDIFEFKVGARCYMVKNIDLIDDLFNGASGTIVGVELNDKKEVKCIIVQFDNENWGANRRARNPGYTEKYKRFNGTPIFREIEEYHLTKGQFATAAKGRLLQFPLRLYYAQTSHKLQVKNDKAFQA